ncbi:hypothetical protein G7Z17_g6573 [Cylindrodendrum hubeiense]|uniref:Uncharacterized protein n=1 Tax=Cylindrodendrum hubeiense TaxID=595255 RepID=A0A9P5LAQ0_9HYPO|nr:hypothetical protein G7Z17_g6573 [Cylindrodendrum hubeiense]
MNSSLVWCFIIIALASTLCVSEAITNYIASSRRLQDNMFKQGVKRTWGEFFLELVGVGESKFLTVGFLIAILLGAVANITVLISCMSSDTRSVYLFRVSTEDLINAATNTTTISANDLRIDGLPNHWYWGFSGVCAIHGNNSDDKVSCKKSFPPTMTIEDMITFAVTTQLDEDTSSAAIAKHIKPWTSALAQVEDDLAPASRPKTYFKAAVALTLISTILSILLLPLGIASLSVLRGKLHRWILYGIAFLDAMSFLGAGILAIYAMNDGPRGLIQLSDIDQGNERTFIGPGFYVLFAGVLFTLISIGLFFCIAFIVLILIIFAVMACFTSVCSGGGSKRQATGYNYDPSHHGGGGGGAAVEEPKHDTYEHPNYYSNSNYYNTQK